MATFCSNCGTALAANTAFCVQCGNPVSNRPNPQPTSTPTAMPVAKSTGGGAMKIVLVLLCCLAVLAAVVVGGIYYAVHRVERAVVQTAKENGVDLNSLTASHRNDSDTDRTVPPACDVLSKQTVSDLIGQPIDHTETNGHECRYFGPAGLSAKLAQEEAAAVPNLADNPDNTKDPLKTFRAFQRPLMRQGEAQNSAGEMPLVAITVSPDGKTAMAALNFTKGIIGAIGKAQSSQQTTDGKEKSLGDAFVGTEVAGLGDKAMWTPSTGLVVLKGDTLIGVNPGPIPDLEARTQAVAKAVIAKL